MIHESICTYEVCKLAREKGFDLHCTPFYALENFTAEYVDDAGDFYEVDFEKGDLYLNFPIKGVLHKEKMLPAPTQSLLQRWLREEKKIYIAISVDIDHDLHRVCFEYEVCYDFDGRTMEYHNSYDSFGQYKDALEDALKWTLENLV